MTCPVSSDHFLYLRDRFLAAVAPDKALAQRAGRRGPKYRSAPARCIMGRLLCCAGGELRRREITEARMGLHVVIRTRRQNAHVTEHREVLYPYHPWFGLTVHVHQTVEKRRSGIVRCSVDGSEAGRWLELPAWMFDRAVCLSTRTADSPRVDLAALEDLRKLLIELRQSPAAMVAAGSGAQKRFRHQNRSSTNGHSAPRFEETAAPSRPVRSVRRPTGRAAMAAAAAGDAVGGDRADGAPSERTPALRASVHRRSAMR